jgi:hypothetical protein
MIASDDDHEAGKWRNPVCAFGIINNVRLSTVSARLPTVSDANSEFGSDTDCTRLWTRVYVLVVFVTE